jgi:hypothetical protein
MAAAAKTTEEIATSQGSRAQNSPIDKGVDSPNSDAGDSPGDGDYLKTVPQKKLHDQPIPYQYLTFETLLPLGCPVKLHGGTSLTLSHFPDIRRYESPFLWSSTRKTVTLILCCAATICAAYSAGAYFMPSTALEKKWSLSTVAFNTGVTTWAVGFALSPMVLAPFSELNGGKPVFTGSGILFIIVLLGCALTDSFAGMFVARFWLVLELARSQPWSEAWFLISTIPTSATRRWPYTVARHWLAQDLARWCLDSLHNIYLGDGSSGCRSSSLV